MFKIYEPDWGLKIIEYLNNFMNSHGVLNYFVPITAEIFVFLFPIVLIVLYVVGIVKNEKSFKESALRIFWCAILTTVVNVCIQFFFNKARPLAVGMGGEKIVEGIDKFLPSSSFPSDHACMSMGFAMGLLLRGIKKKDNLYIGIGIIFLIFSLIMSVSRVIVGEHWPTDILGGFAVGIIVTLILDSKSVYKILNKILIDPLIRFQCRLFNKFKNNN